mmetsp:Transcript_32268/g.93211  ORF Transcript_32268/g.93211 Transcript_32268/m.93211 type:complete len:150 (+) Transcript_32268:119-568(+)|eukprot:CAMPEP_0177202682 /NCGR_PEP_ID=MMETSP0367-20130122/27416_1 /TAXON_ID=447022 ORGANISM="Scrippsiella hangoei-like, Strain SHHI-4" /NCGR_SAMPLE_ID=MMETSP0367 /ASSEMBLY_ACC=CAM_ASM_000362 /LENGTH=149 /DNA_ID=CAMNT_0018651271 /DNA_START=109 /DNA_END=558 /DNA_ORIENTATION=-
MGGACCSEEANGGQDIQTIDSQDEKLLFDTQAMFEAGQSSLNSSDTKQEGPLGDDVIGDWITERGRYSVMRGVNGELTFNEQCSKTHILSGVLVQAGEWWQTEIKNKLEGDKVYGYLRVKVEGAGLRTSFKKLTPNADWDKKGFFARRV